MPRIAVVGLGGIAQKAYLPLLAAWDGVELLVCSRRPESVARVRERYRIERGSCDLDELLSWRPQAALVLTPSATHGALAARLLDAGVDVFVEKPATLTSAETAALGERAASQGRVLMVGFNRRFAPLHVQARELWAGRRVGLGVFEKHRSDAAHPDLLANFIDDTIHLVDLVRFFCGEAEAVATTQLVRDGRLVEAVALVALESGGQAAVMTSLEAGGWRESCSLHGDGASLQLEAFSRLDWQQTGQQRRWREAYAAQWTPTLEARGFPQQITHFLDCVASRRAPASSAAEAARTQRLLEDIVARLRP
jgi:virulence factor